MDKKTIFVIISLLLIFFSPLMRMTIVANVNENSSFDGNGTYNNPYLISSLDDLYKLQKLVNSGHHFKDIYFQQTANINLNKIEWIPIGEFGTDNSFEGIYNGNGHYIENLYISHSGNNGFFGQLGGIVINLGIESGEIHGSCVGSISSHAFGSEAKIVNCYNKAAVYGNRAGGIADNFNGLIANCWTDCILVGDTVGDIYSYSALYAANNFTNNNGHNQVNSTLLNSSLVNSSTLTGIELNTLNKWIEKDGQVQFSLEKRNLQLSDLPQLIKSNITKILLTLIITIQIILFLYINPKNVSN